jgi:hypothetical protein
VSGLSNGSTYVYQLTVSDGSLTASDQVQVTVASAGSYYAIRNRWKGTYLYDAGANVGYGATIANNNYKWEKVAVDATYFYWRNLGTGEYMHIENQTGSVQCSAITLGWWSAQWSQESVDATFLRLRNRWQTGNIIHVEGQTGSAQYSGAQDGWYSAMWELVAQTSGQSEGSPIVMDELSSDVIDVYPNPVVGKEINVTIPQLKDGEHAEIQIQDINGKTALRANIQKSTSLAHDLVPGLYLLKVQTSRINTVKKVIVK